MPIHPYLQPRPGQAQLRQRLNQDEPAAWLAAVFVDAWRDRNGSAYTSGVLNGIARAAHCMGYGTSAGQLRNDVVATLSDNHGDRTRGQLVTAVTDTLTGVYRDVDHTRVGSAVLRCRARLP